MEVPPIKIGGMVGRPSRQKGKQGRRRTVSGNGSHSPPPLFPFFTPNACTIPPPTIGGGGTSSPRQIFPKIDKMITLRNQQVILDSDVAELYGVQTKRVNEAVSNNPEKFPEGYIVELSDSEKNELVENFDRFNNQKHSTVVPKAFTEKGLYMLATILKSPKAVETTIAIVEAYAKLRELAQVIAEVSQHEDDKAVQQSLMQRGGQLAAELLTDNLPIQSSETSVELNLAMFKLKHTVKRENDNEERIARLEAELAELKKERQ